MADSDHFFFSKKYKVAVKHDQDAFYIRYQLCQQRDSSPTHINENSNPISQPPKHQQQSNDKKKHHTNDKPKHLIQDQNKKTKYKPYKKHEYIQKKQEETQQKQQAKPETKLVTVQSEKIENLPRQISATLSEKITKSQKQGYSNLDLIPLKTRISEIEEEQELEAQSINKENASLINSYSSPKKILRQQSIYINYKSMKEIAESRENNENIYFKGRVQFSSEVKWNARIYSDEKDGYLLAEGKNNLNRALHQDQVYFKIVHEQKEYLACEIVAIISRRNKELVGKIQKPSDSNEFFLRPINRKIAKMTVNEDSFDKKWTTLIQTHYFLCEFVSWQLDQSFPICKVIDVYGLGGDIAIETNALLKTSGVQWDNNNRIPSITQSFSNFYDKDMQFRIPEQEIKKRRDFRKWKTFVVQDTLYDVAFSIFPQITRSKGDPNFLKKNINQINIHILDLAFFVNRNAALDEFLRQKMTRFNLTYKIISMLPQCLAKATSFELNKERLTLSICVQVSENGTILDSVKATTSVIAPQCILSRAQLQKWINTQKMSQQQLKTFNCIFKLQSEFANFGKDLKLFAKLMNKARTLRIQQGAFSFQQPSKGFEFDQKNRPIKFELQTKTEVDFILQECIVICQTKIAEFMMKGYKQKAILYRHRYPGTKMLERLKMLTAKAGYHIEDPKKQIFKSINSILSDQKVKQVLKQAIKYLISKLIQNSDYFQSEAEDPTKWNNFAFNVAMFTHCVLPTKKYGDILVQKQLVALIQHKQFKVQNLKKILQEVNKGTLRCRTIRAQSQKIILCHYLRQHPAFTTGILLQVFEWGLKVCVTKYGFKTIIKFQDIPSLRIIKSDADSNNQFKSNLPAIETFFVLKQLQEIEVQVRCSKTIPYNYQVVLVMPNPADTKQKILIE